MQNFVYTIFHSSHTYIVYAQHVWPQQPITAENIDMIVGELTNIVSQVSDPADQSSDNLNVIATVFSSTTSLIASGNISVSDTVSIIVCTNYLPVVHNRNNLLTLFVSISIRNYTPSSVCWKHCGDPWWNNRLASKCSRAAVFWVSSIPLWQCKWNFCPSLSSLLHLNKAVWFQLPLFFLVINVFSLPSIVNSFETITENLVDQENFTNITIQEESLAFRGERVSQDGTSCWE